MFGFDEVVRKVLSAVILQKGLSYVVLDAHVSIQELSSKI